MFCTLKALAACFQLGGIYFDASAVHTTLHETRFFERVTDFQRVNAMPAAGVTTPGPDYTYRLQWYKQEIEHNPRAAIAVGYTVHFTPRLTAYVQSAYEKDLDVGDINGWRHAIGARWYPFSR
jgi:hypothetical protein